jgi:hypothetical protein
MKDEAALRAELDEARDLLETARQRADLLEGKYGRLQAEHEKVTRELYLIYRSKTWRLWMSYIALRRRLLRLFRRTSMPPG